MTKVILFSDAEIGEPSDFQAVSQAAREGDENLAGGAIGYPNHWANFTIATPTSVTVRVNEGRIFVGKTVYDLDAAADIDMQVHLPIVVGDERYVAILARGVARTVEQQRFVETDVETGATVLTPLPKIDDLTVEFAVQEGLASPTPLKPLVADTNCCVCYVRLGNTGIMAVESNNDRRVKTLYEIEGRVTILEAQMAIAFQRTQTLATDLANVQATLRDYAKLDLVMQHSRDLARLRRLANLPDEARGYFYDPGLVKDQWDVNNARWLARVDEGIRFPWAAQRDMQLTLLDEAQAGIRITDRVLMPDWTEVKRIEVDGAGSTKNISQQVHTVTTPVQRFISRSEISYGPTVAMCENNAEWSAVGQVRVGGQFAVKGETFESVGAIDATYANKNVDLSLFGQYMQNNWSLDQIVLHNSQPGNKNGHLVYAARSVQARYWEEPYWEYITEKFGISGSVYAQTFLLTQPQVMTSIELKFDRVDTDGDVTLMLCEVSDTGQPLFDAVIARSTLAPAKIKAGWVRFPFTPRYLPPGKRYAWVTVTTGNYSLFTVTGSQYTQGTLFWSTDQAWFQGSPEEDFCFRINAAEFKTTRVQVEFDALSLENGMTEIRLVYENWAPDGTQMMWEVLPSGREAWEQLRPETDDVPNPLRGLPALCRLRLTMIGTTGLAPAIVLNSKARGETRRPRGDARARTKLLQFGYSATRVDVELSIDQFDDSLHDVIPRMFVGATPYTPTLVTLQKDFTKATRSILKASFSVPATTSAALEIDQTTTTVQSVCFIENASLYAL